MVVTVFVVLVSGEVLGFRFWMEYAIESWPSAGAAAKFHGHCVQKKLLSGGRHWCVCYEKVNKTRSLVTLVKGR